MTGLFTLQFFEAEIRVFLNDSQAIIMHERVEAFELLTIDDLQFIGYIEKNTRMTHSAEDEKEREGCR